MSDGHYDYAYERMLARDGLDLVYVDGVLRQVRRGPMPAQAGDDEPSRAELAEDERDRRKR